jgi:hypothetical protein
MRSDKSGILGPSLITYESEQIIQFRYSYSSESTAKCMTKIGKGEELKYFCVMWHFVIFGNYCFLIFVNLSEHKKE